MRAGSPRTFLNKSEQLRGLLSPHRKQDGTQDRDAGAIVRSVSARMSHACGGALACLTFKFFLYILHAKGYAFDSSAPQA